MHRTDPSSSASFPLLDFGDLAAPHVLVPEAEAAEIATERWGVTGTVRRFASEKDDTFRLAGPGGDDRILKIANPAGDVDVLDMEVAILAHVARVDPGLPVPRVFPDRDGHTIPTIVDRAGQTRRARLLSFLSGTVLDTIDIDAGEREQIGMASARLRFAMEGFAHPAADRFLPWDVRRLPRLAPLLAHVRDAEQRRLLEAALARFVDLEPRIAALRRQVLHNDFSRSNLVVDRAHPDFVVGIIDFGDAVETAVAIDIATALLNQLPREFDPRSGRDLFAEGRDVLRGYLRLADLTDEERALIPHLVMGRIVARALLTLWRAELVPENATYILRNTAPGWTQLPWFLDRSVDDVSAHLLA